MLDALKRYFGHESFRNAQEEVVARLMSGEDLCVVMPTGAGKSLCYQLPILLRPGYGLIVSPLISLMKDQVDQLNGKHLPAACINSAYSLAEQQRTLEDVRAGRIKYLYVAPERFRSQSFRFLLQSMPPNLVVVDEAHCVSQWGHDFRPDYQLIWRTAPEVARLQIAAFTATATPPVREDIKAQLGRPEMADIVSGFRRGNLSFEVMKFSSKREKTDNLRQLLKKAMPTIIYGATRKEVDMLSDALQCRSYHAGLSEEERRRSQDYFMQDQCPVLVATNAFGMGIDRPDIRRVIHYSIPKSLEAYYQEAGRAGRDGEAAECILFYCYQDVRIQEYLLEINNPEVEKLLVMHRLLLRLEQRNSGHPVFAEDLGAGEGKDGQIAQASINILARYGILERRYGTRSLGGTLSFLYPLDAKELHFGGPLTQRSLFLERMTSWFRREHMQTFSCTVEQMSQETGLRVEQVERVLAALNGQCLHWQPIQVGGEAVQLTELGRKEELQIDLAEQKAHAQIEYGRLDAVKAYAETGTCRQAYLVSYFGEKIGQWKCGRCDCCQGKGSHALPQREIMERKIVLEAVEEFNGRYGIMRVAKMLHGEEDPNKEELNESGSFGQLEHTSLKHILGLLRSLIREGEVSVVDKGGYPCLEV